MNAKPGYIIMLTLLIIAVAVALVTAIVRQSFTYQRYAGIARAEVHARLLALSSVEIAAAKISLILEKEKKEVQPQPPQNGGQKKKETLQPLAQWLLKILPQINRWQSFEINEGADGGVVKLYLSAEQGKIPLTAFQKELMELGEKNENQGQQLSDEQPEKLDGTPGKNNQPPKSNLQQPGRQQPQGSLLKVVDELLSKEKGVSVKEALKKLASDLQRMPEDGTELLRASQMAPFKEQLFVTLNPEKKDIVLMDLFSAHTGKGKINPWLLSASLKKLLGIGEGKEQKTNEELVKKLKPRMQWARDWDDIFAQQYGKKFDALPKEIAAALGDEFEATAFSVVSYSTVGTVTQKLYALLELTQPDKDLDPKSMIFKVTKLYWLS